MYYSTEIIILKSIKYSDSSSIVQAYSRHFGRISFMVRGINQRKGKFRPAFFLPGTLLDTNVSYRGNKNLHSFKEVQISSPIQSCHQDIDKNAIITLLCELLQKCLREEEGNSELFDYIKQSILILDSSALEFSNFHLVFMLGLTRYLGFYPYLSEAFGLPFFDLQSGCFVSLIPPHPNYVNSEFTKYLLQLMTENYQSMNQIRLNRAKRNELLKILIQYYQLQLPGMGKLNSHEVLQELFD